jgi:Protein of unknown function (DUF5131)
MTVAAMCVDPDATLATASLRWIWLHQSTTSKHWTQIRTRTTLADNSAIEWTEATWNPVTGCDKVSPGCAHCYAETFAERWRGIPGHPYEQGFALKLWPQRLEQPLKCTAARREEARIKMLPRSHKLALIATLSVEDGTVQVCSVHTPSRFGLRAGQ